MHIHTLSIVSSPCSVFTVKEKRADVVKTMKGDPSVTEITKKIGAVYRGLSASELAVYQKKADKLKDAYTKKLTAYKKTANFRKHEAAVKAWKTNTSVAKKEGKKVAKKAAKKGKKSKKKKVSKKSKKKASSKKKRSRR